MEVLTLLLCLLLTAFQAVTANTTWSWITDNPLNFTEGFSELCGGNMTDWRGVLLSPRYPNNYPNSARCTWTIHSTGNTTVSLTFTDVDLETCCDYIKVYDGPSTHHPLLGEIREYSNQFFKSSNNDLTVFFYSDSSVTRRGFHANWVFVDSNSCRNNCGYFLGSCSCHYSCQHNSNCCSDYNYYCSSTTIWPQPTTANPTGSWTTDSNSCRNNCGYSFGSCSCHYSCQYYSNCCYDYNHYCSSTTIWPQPTTANPTGSWTTEHVTCSSDNMVIVIQRSYLNSLGLSGNDLYVDNHHCRPTVSSTEVVFRFPLDACGTIKGMMNGYVSYTNNVRGSKSQSGEITRQSQFLLRVGCRMEPDTMVQIFYKAKENINDNITGTGHFGANIAFYTSSSFYQQIYDSPYEVIMNQLLYVQVALNRPDNSLLLFLDTCVASPNPNDFKDRSYDLLRNGCPRDDTYYSYTSGQRYYAQFSFQAFKFLRTHAYVYLQCKVIICPSNDYNSRCRQGCRPRRKRSLDSTYHTNTLTLGPIKLKGA